MLAQFGLWEATRRRPLRRQRPVRTRLHTLGACTHAPRNGALRMRWYDVVPPQDRDPAPAPRIDYGPVSGLPFSIH